MGEEPFQFRIVDKPPSLGHIKSELDQRVLDIINLKWENADCFNVISIIRDYVIVIKNNIVL